MFVYVIYDLSHFSVFEVFSSEEECLSCFEEMKVDYRDCDGGFNFNWIAINVKEFLFNNHLIDDL